MGLGISVGFLGLIDDDPVGVRSQLFDEVNRVLTSEGLPTHEEPLTPPATAGYQMCGYSGLHYVRRAGAHLWKMGHVDGPGDDDASDDAVLAEYCRSVELAQGKRADVLRIWTPGDRPTFDHVIRHHDDRGLYLPIDFERVIVYDCVAGGNDAKYIGSTHRLLAECTTIANHLGVPLDLDPESDEVWDASEGEGDAPWVEYGIEGYCLLRLIRACELANEHRMALVFH